MTLFAESVIIDMVRFSEFHGGLSVIWNKLFVRQVFCVTSAAIYEEKSGLIPIEWPEKRVKK